MRSFLNSILAFINVESLTDDEFNSIDLTEETYSVETYNALKEVMSTRGEFLQMKKLKAFFIAKGVTELIGDKVYQPASNILIGGEL